MAAAEVGAGGGGGERRGGGTVAGRGGGVWVGVGDEGVTVGSMLEGGRVVRTARRAEVAAGAPQMRSGAGGSLGMHVHTWLRLRFERIGFVGLEVDWKQCLRRS
jgi:hypothetical protein